MIVNGKIKYEGRNILGVFKRMKKIKEGEFFFFLINNNNNKKKCLE